MTLSDDTPAGEDSVQTLLRSIPGMEPPERARAGMLTAPDGRRLRYALFPALGRPLQGTVIIVTGRNECIEKYYETVRDLSDKGLGSAVMDLRGQGASERMLRDPQRGYVNGFDEYVADLETFFEEVVLPDCRPPYYLLAHSTGALVALLVAPAMVNRIRRMVLCAPLLEIVGLPFSMRATRNLSATLYNLGLGSRYFGKGRRPPEPEPFATNKLTTDPVRYARNVELYRRHPELALGGPTVAWLHAVCRAIDTVTDPDFMARIQIPMLFIAAGADEVVSTRAIEDYATHLRVGSLLTVDGARHEILQEADVYREQFLAAFHAFVPGRGEAF